MEIGGEDNFVATAVHIIGAVTYPFIAIGGSLHLPDLDGAGTFGYPRPDPAQRNIILTAQ